MKLGVLSVVFGDRSLEDALKFFQSHGVQTVEIGCGGFPGSAHLDAENFDNNKANELKALIKKYNMEISALSCHANPVHPNKEVADKAHQDFVNACKAAELLGVDTIITFSGCPGDSPNSAGPNWVTCPWPNDFLDILDYQWNQVLIPYWKKAAEIAKSHGVSKIALEMHPGFCVYNPETLLRLREAVGGEIIGANFDPSHLFWQGIDAAEAIMTLKGAIHHFHAKDSNINKRNTEINGVLDTKSYLDIAGRSWSFRTIGYGHDAAVWKNIISALRLSGYDGAVSIEHEDGLMSQEEGLAKAIDFLRDIIIFEPAADMWWV